jgi:UDPglucose 6-dehydrogenase
VATAALGDRLHGGKVGVLGLSFKPHSDDVRDSPALDVAVQLHGLGADVLATDPKSIENARAKHPQLNFSESIEDTLRDAELVVLVTEWPEFVKIDPVWAATLVKNRSIIDGRNALDAAAWRAAGWTYRGMGRP